MGIETAIIGGAVSAFSANKARKDAKKQSRRLENTGAAAAEDVYFKPVGLTTSQGNVGFNSEGRANVALDPRYQQLQDQLFEGAGSLASEAQNFNTQATAQQLADQQFSLLQPQLQADQANLAQTLFGTGRGGLTVAGSGSGAGAGGMVNPDVFGFNQALAQQRGQIAADAQNQAFARQAQLQGLLGGQLQQLGGIGAVESQLLQQALSQEAQRSQQSAAAGGIKTGTANAAAGIQAQGNQAFTNALGGLGTGLATAGVKSFLGE